MNKIHIGDGNGWKILEDKLREFHKFTFLNMERWFKKERSFAAANKFIVEGKIEAIIKEIVLWSKRIHNSV